MAIHTQFEQKRSQSPTESETAKFNNLLVAETQFNKSEM